MPVFRHLRSHAVPLLFLCVLWGAVFWRVLFASGADRVVFPQGDFYNHYYNFATFQIERWNAGQFPLWNPYNGAGDPFAANIQLNTFYPPRWVTALVWGRDGWQVEDHLREGAVHILITSLLMYGFVAHKQRRRLAAVLAAVLWAYGGYLMSYPLQQTAVLAAAVWFPLMLWGVWWVFQPDGIRGGLLLGSAGIGLSLLGGHPQTTLYLLYAVMSYGLYLGLAMQPAGTWSLRQGVRPFIQALAGIALRLGGMGLLGAAFSAMQILPSLEFMRLSGRLNEFSYEQKAQGFVLSDVLQILAPGVAGPMSPLYASIGGACLALLALVIPLRSKSATETSVSHPRETFLWLAMGLVALGIGLGSQTPLYSVAYTLMPGISVFRQPERAALVTQMALVLLAVEGCLVLMRSDLWALFARRFSVVSVFPLIVLPVLSAAAFVSALETPQQDARALILFNGLAFALWWALAVRMLWSRPRLMRGMLPVLALLLTLDLGLQMRQSVPYVPATPETQIALAPIMESIRVTDPTQMQWRVDGAVGLRDDGLRFRIPNIYHAGPLAIAAMEEIRHLPVDRFWEVLSVRYATLSTDRDAPAEWGLIPLGEGTSSSRQPFRLYELPDPRPLAVLVYDSRDGGGDQAFARQIMADDRVNLREMAITTLPLAVPLPVTRPPVSEIRDVVWQSPESLTLTASTGSNALLTLSIPRYPGWQAWVNGKPVDTVEVYGGLIGIPLETGRDQTISLGFFSRPVVVGVLVSLGAVLMWLGISLGMMRRA